MVSPQNTHMSLSLLSSIHPPVAPCQLIPCQLIHVGVPCSDLIPFPIALIENYSAAPYNFRKLQESIYSIVRGPSGHTPQPSMPSSLPNGGNYSYPAGNSPDYVPPAHRFTGATSTAQQLGSYGNSSAASSSTLNYYKNAHQALRDLQFKPSPFYSILSRIGEIRTCDGKHTAAILTRASSRHR